MVNESKYWIILPGTTLRGINGIPQLFLGVRGDVEEFALNEAKEKFPTYPHWKVKENEYNIGGFLVIGKITEGDVVENTAFWRVYLVELIEKPSSENEYNHSEARQKLIETDFGPIIFQDESSVVRAIRKSDGLHVYAHGKYNDGVEKLPLGYVLGDNLLIYKYGEGK